MNRPPKYANVRIVALDRLVNSVNGNPRYRVSLGIAGGIDSYVTSSDAAFCYSITNREMRGPVDVWFTRNGRIEHIEPSAVG
ncbi:MAG: hypothetical protein ACRDRD_12450 [Pseudonocardiaceae bacterium]